MTQARCDTKGQFNVAPASEPIKGCAQIVMLTLEGLQARYLIGLC
jgi:hypothetical protein